MPLYEYRCTSCGYSFEKIQSFSAEPEKVCPKCQGELVRPVTAPALRFAGAGWYVNDYAAKGGAKSGDSGSTSANPSTDSSKPAETKSAESTVSAPAATPAASSTPSSSGSSSSSSS